MLLRSIFKRRPGLGCIPSGFDQRDRDFEVLGLSARGLPELDVVLEQFWSPWDQVYTSSCTGHAVAAAMTVIERAKRGDPSYPALSRADAYLKGRAVRMGRGARVLDDGARLRDVFHAINRLGCASERDWPFDPRRVNDTTPMPAAIRGVGRRGGEYVRIFERGPQKTLAARAAFAAGLTVVYGTAITRSFLEFMGPGTVNRDPREAIAGHHAMFALGADARGGRTRLRCANSYGLTYREGGFFWMDAEWFERDDVEAWVMHAWEGLGDA